MRYFLIDSSALIKRYYPEIGSSLVDHLFASTKSNQLSAMMLGVAETVAGVVRKRNGGNLKPSLFILAMSKLEHEILRNVAFSKLPIDNSLIERAVAYLDRHAINATDAALLQIAVDQASALREESHDIVLVSADQRLVRSAQAEGLSTFDPERQDQVALDALIGP